MSKSKGKLSVKTEAFKAYTTGQNMGAVGRRLISHYVKTAKVLISVIRYHVPLHECINPKENKFSKSVFNLARITTQYLPEIDYLLKKFNIVAQSKLLDEFMARLLVAELIWGEQKPITSIELIKSVAYWEDDLREAMSEVSVIMNDNSEYSKRYVFPTYVRINTLSITIEKSLHAFQTEGWNLLPRCNSYSEFLQVVENLSGRDFVRDYHISELLVFPRKTSFYDHSGYLRGKFVIQDKGSCLSSFLLNPKPGSTVLDLCAAPGLKTNHLANIMNNQGIIYANDEHLHRLNRMNKLLELTEVTCVKSKNSDVLHLEIENPEDIKYILLDPSCTYSGMLSGNSGKPQKSKASDNTYELYQELRYALLNFPNVKRVVFTTNSLYPEEGEVVIDEAMHLVRDAYTLLDTKEMLWNEWESTGIPGTICGSKCLRAVPELDHCHGYFIAVFERNFDVPLPPFILENSQVTTFVRKILARRQKFIPLWVLRTSDPDEFNKKIIKKSKKWSRKRKNKLSSILVPTKSDTTLETTSMQLQPTKVSLQPTKVSLQPTKVEETFAEDDYF